MSGTLVETVESELVVIPGLGKDIALPTQQNGKFLSLGLVEVGCRANGKRGQLKDKRQVLRDFLVDAHPKGIFDFYRILVYFNGTSKSNGKKKDPHQVDLIFHFKEVPGKVLELVTPEDIGALVRKVTTAKQFREDYVPKPKYKHQRPPKKKRQRVQVLAEEYKDIVREILEGKDQRNYMKIIRGESLKQGHSSIARMTGVGLSNLRGMLTEVMVMRAIQYAIDQCGEGISYHSNVDLAWKSKRYSSGTELDGILQFYDDRLFLSLLNALDGIDGVNLTAGHKLRTTKNGFAKKTNRTLVYAQEPAEYHDSARPKSSRLVRQATYHNKPRNRRGRR